MALHDHRIRVLAVAALLAFSAVAARLVYLQVFQRAKYAELALRVRSWDEIEPSVRGRILDRRGRILATNRPSFDVSAAVAGIGLTEVTVSDVRTALDELSREEMKSRRRAFREGLEKDEPVVRKLAEWTGRPVRQVAGALYRAIESAARYNTGSRKQTILHDVSPELWLRALAAERLPRDLKSLRNLPKEERTQAIERMTPGLPSLKGFHMTHGVRRVYPCGTACCHVLGYVGTYSREDVAALRECGRIVMNDSRILKRWRKMVERSQELRSEASGLLGCDPDAFTSGAELTSALRSLDHDSISRLLDRLPHEDRGRVTRWLNTPDTVTLNGGEGIWVSTRTYLADTTIGQAGVEYVHNERLRGHHGYKVLVRVAQGTVELLDRPADASHEENLHRYDPVPGEDLHLTLDLPVQLAAERALDATGHPSACVLLDTRNGEVIALASRPAFDPNLFAPPRSNRVSELMTNPGRPMVNRAISGCYSPGSVFKVVNALGSLSEGAINEDTTFYCDGVLRERRSRHRCLGHHGEISVLDAMRVSCNIFFYHSGRELGARKLHDWALALGLGRRTGIVLPGERSGLVPSPQWKQAALGIHWMEPAETYHFAIGQGYLQVTPLQLAVAIAAVAEGGRVPVPHVVKGETKGQARDAQAGEHFAALDSNARRIVVEGMTEVVNEVGGTAYRAFRSFRKKFPEILVAGKTGSAEHARSISGKEKTHAWFAGFAPVDNPEVSFAVVVEKSGHGGSVAAPVAAAVLDAYFSDRRHGKNE